MADPEVFFIRNSGYPVELYRVPAGESGEAHYRALLTTHDWEYQFSDDQTVYNRGRIKERILWTMQPSVDPGFEIWNELAPEQYRFAGKESTT